MTAPTLARWAARRLEAEAPADGTVPIDAADRLRSIAALERALGDRRRRRTRLRWARGLALAASVALCAGLGGMAMQRAAHTAVVAQNAANAPAAPTTPTTAAAPMGAGAGATFGAAPLTIIGHVSGSGASISTATAQVRAGEPLVAGSRVVAHGTSHAILAFSTGTELSVEDEGDMTILEEGRSQVFALDTGAVRAHVAKLGAGERFVVHTPDAEVEVRGTSFRVAVAASDPSCGAGSVTRVTVDEGVVVVRHANVEARVARGETWPAGCDGPSSAPGQAVASLSGAQSSASPAIAAASKDHRTGASTLNAPMNLSTNAPTNATATASSLADQNDAFAEALALKHGGQDDAAVSAFERFVARYPASNLAESAAVERMKILLADDHAKGVAAAAQYLRRYPTGFARAAALAAVGR